MGTPNPSFDSDTVKLMGQVCDQVWHELSKSIFFPHASDAVEIRRTIAVRVMTAVIEGERDAQRLRAVARDAIEA